jgi:hypothetical protein
MFKAKAAATKLLHLTVFVLFYFINTCKQTNSEFIDLRQKPQKDKQSKQAELRPLLESVVIENLKNQI